MTRIQRIVSTNPAPSQLRPGWLASVLLLGGLVGATSITAYGLSIRENDDPPAAGIVVSDGPVVAAYTAGVVSSGPAANLADATDSAQELLRIKRARLQKLAKEIAELEEQCGQPSIAQVKRASGPTAATVVARPQPSADRGAFRGVVVNRFGRPSEVAELPVEGSGVRLDVKPVIKDGSVIELSAEPVAIATGVGATTKVLATQERSVPEALRALGYLGGVPVAETHSDAQEALQALGYLSGVPVTETDSDAQETLRALGYLSGDSDAGPAEIATVVRSTTTTTAGPSIGTGTAAVASLPRLDKKVRGAGQVISTESKPDKAEIQRLSDEIDVLKRIIEDLNKKLDGKGKTD